MWCFPGRLWCIIGDLLYLGPLPPPSKSLSLPVLHRLALLLIGYSCLLSLWLCAASPLPRLKIFYAERYGVQTLGTPRMTTVLVLRVVHCNSDHSVVFYHRPWVQERCRGDILKWFFWRFSSWSQTRTGRRGVIVSCSSRPSLPRGHGFFFPGTGSVPCLAHYPEQPP